MTHLTELPDPYAGLDPSRHCIQMSARVGATDMAFIRAICPEKGLITRMTQLFFWSIAEELRQSKIEHYTPENVERLLAIIHKRTIGGCPSSELARQRLQLNDAGGAAGACERVEGCGDFDAQAEANDFQREAAEGNQRVAS